MYEHFNLSFTMLSHICKECKNAQISRLLWEAMSAYMLATHFELLVIAEYFSRILNAVNFVPINVNLLAVDPS